jgi:hypothetical protein
MDTDRRTRLAGPAVLALAAGLLMVACRDDGIRLTAALSGVGTGTADIEISSDRSQICWDIQGLVGSVDGDATAMHIHSGAEGDRGPVVVDLISGNEACAEYVPASTLREIVEEPANYYVEVHSEQHPDGAVRGQLEAASR